MHVLYIIETFLTYLQNIFYKLIEYNTDVIRRIILIIINMIITK